VADTNAARLAVASEASGQIISVLRGLLAERYPDLGHHVHTVASLCERVAPQFEMPLDEREALTRAALLHDIGKLSLPESILRKAEPLDEDEWRLMRRHTIIGSRILAAAGLDGSVIDFVRSSHERIDGTGYPDGLRGEEIPLGARIISACDAYDAMTTGRPYRPGPMTHDGAVLELMRGSDTQFDSAVVDALSETLLHEGSPSVLSLVSSRPGG
jgi:two-component system cell cycle response regulator